jgi:TatD DNase family protein
MIDTHCHLNLIDKDAHDVMASAEAVGVSHIIQVSIDHQTIVDNLNTYCHIPNCSVAAGIHPLSVTDSAPFSESLALMEANIDSFVAIGEIGLDYKYGTDNATEQKAAFVAQLELAQRFNKPVIIHNRQADADMLEIVNAYPNIKKVFHCYATHIDFFHALTGESNYVSFTGIITYSKKGKVVRACRDIPLEKMMIETDAPYILPKGVDSDQNRPEFVVEVAKAMAEIKQVSLEEVIASTTRTAEAFFNLKE